MINQKLSEDQKIKEIVKEELSNLIEEFNLSDESVPQGHIPIHCFLSAPELLGEKLVGQVSLANSDRDYAKCDLEVIERLATLYAIAIQRKCMEAVREKIQAQFIQARKMEAVGRLSGGLAHDLNNLMTAIISYSSFLLANLNKDNSMRRDIEQIKKAGDQASSLVQQLLAFRRRHVMQPTVLNLNDVIVETEKMLRRMIGEDVEMETVQ